MNRFDLEEAIMSCWGTKEDIQLVSERVLEDDELSQDSLANVLTGMAEMHDMRCKKLFEIFEEMISSGRITGDVSEEI
jgi:hypothetical protein